MPQNRYCSRWSMVRPVPRLKNEYRYQFLIKAVNRTVLNELLHRVRHYSLEKKWGATALVIDVDPVTLM